MIIQLIFSKTYYSFKIFHLLLINSMKAEDYKHMSVYHAWLIRGQCWDVEPALGPRAQTSWVQLPCPSRDSQQPPPHTPSQALASPAPVSSDALPGLCEENLPLNRGPHSCIRSYQFIQYPHQIDSLVQENS